MVDSEPAQDVATNGNNKCETENQSLDKKPFGLHLEELLVLLCCKDTLRVYAAKSIAQVTLLLYVSHLDCTSDCSELKLILLH